MAAKGHASIARLMRMAAARASPNFPLANLLLGHRSKIEQLRVGIHFYQTECGGHWRHASGVGMVRASPRSRVVVALHRYTGLASLAQ